MGFVWLLLVPTAVGLLSWTLFATTWLWYAAIAMWLPLLYTLWTALDSRNVPHRPAARMVNSFFGLALASGSHFAIGSLVRVDCADSPMTKWSIGSGAFEHAAYGYRRIPISPSGPTLSFSPGMTLFGSARCAIGKGGSWTEHVYPLWTPFAVFAVSASLLAGFRRERVPDGQCRSCEYDLTGNSSGRCPECGAPRRPIAAQSEEPPTNRRGPE